MTHNATKILPPSRTSPGPSAVHSNPLGGTECHVIAGFHVHGFISIHCCCKAGSSSDMFSGNPLTVNQTLFALKQR